EPLGTDSDTPFTEMTAEVGGAVGGAGGVFGGVFVPPPEEGPLPEPPPEDFAGPLALNGALLSKSEKGCDWPVSAGGFTCVMGRELFCAVVSVPAGATVEPVVGTAPSEGAAGAPVDGVGVGFDAFVPVIGAAVGFEPAPPPLFRLIIVCTA